MPKHVPLGELEPRRAQRGGKVLGKKGAASIDKLWVGFVAPENIATQHLANEIAAKIGGPGAVGSIGTVTVQQGGCGAHGGPGEPSHHRPVLRQAARGWRKNAVALPKPRPVLCPSAQPEVAGSMAFGVVGGSAEEPRVTWIEKPVPVTGDLLALTGAVPPTQVLRIAAPCQENGCCHFDGTDCRLATKLVQLMPAVSESIAALPHTAGLPLVPAGRPPACMVCAQS